MRSKYKEFYLEGEFYTDGDYWIDLDNLDLKGTEFEKCFDKYNDYEQTYRFTLQTDDIYKVRDFLEILISIYRCGPNHYWLVKALYDMTEPLLDSILFDDEIAEDYVDMGGNYEGTYIQLNKF